MALRMGKSAQSSAAKTPVGSVLAAHPGVVTEMPMASEKGRDGAGILDGLPEELRDGGRDLISAVAKKIAVAEHFDAFCVRAFSKPDWAAAASPAIAEIFEEDEDLLAELARIPDLIIEMGSGEVTVTCMVASRWAARGETHRLSRLADAIVASHASKSACAVEVMLALAATLAVTRFSRAEQLFNAALPLAGEEHHEALADARHWLAAGRIACSATQEERDFWDVRLRKPRAVWAWETDEERRALDTLSERLTPDMEGSDLFRAIVPGCWWDLAAKCAQQQEKLALASRQPSAARVEAESAARTAAVPPTQAKVVRELPNYPRAGDGSRFILGWLCGMIATAITMIMLPATIIQRIRGSFGSSSAGISAAGNGAGSLQALRKHKSTAEGEAWRKENLQRVSEEMLPFASLHATAKMGGWEDNKALLVGDSSELPYASPDYMKFLVWLHLDPPKDVPTRKKVSELLLKRVQTVAISLWEELMYDGSVNAPEIKDAAREALADSETHWDSEQKLRLQAIADFDGHLETAVKSTQ